MTTAVELPSGKPGWPIEALIPHSSTMVLLQRLEDYGDDFLEASLEITPDSLFLNAEQQVPSWVGIEYMAQTIAAYAGVKAKQQGADIKVGLLIGTRRFEAFQPAFESGMRLKIRVAELHQEGSGLGVFECTISCSDTPLAKANLNVYQPKNIDEFMAGVGE